MLWVFGYGSLVFRPAFPFVRSEAGVIRGYSRRFWQGSTDHRGVPGAPGRVVTLIAHPEGECWGRAYHVDDGARDAVLHTLDVREQGGYDRLSIPAYRPDGSTLTDEALVYVANPTNPNWLGEAPLATIASEARVRSGPSGQNADYILRLAEALHEMGAHDAHVFELAALLGAPSR